MTALRSIFIWTAIGFFFFVNFLLVIPVFLVTFFFDRDRVAANWVFMKIGWWMMSVTPSGKIRHSGTHHKPPGAFIAVANHSSFMDMATIAMLPWNMKWVSKKELFWVPVVGWIMFMTGQVYLDRNRRDAIKQLDGIGPTLKRGNPVMMFPEGTRSEDGALQRFKRGAFVLAREHNVPVLPIAMKGTARLLPARGWKFYKAGGVTVQVLEPVNPMDFESAEAMADACRARIEKALETM